MSSMEDVIARISALVVEDSELHDAVVRLIKSMADYHVAKAEHHRALARKANGIRQKQSVAR